MSKESQKSQGLHQEKLNKGSILVVDIASIPREHGLDIEQWSKLIREQGIAFYDSESGNAPFYSQPNDTIKTYDVREEEAMSELEALLKEEDKKYDGGSNKLEFDSVNHLDTNNLIVVTDEGLSEEAVDAVLNPVASAPENLAVWNEQLVEEMRGSLGVPEPSSGVSNVVPLTSEEVEQLSVLDPRGGEGLTDEEHDIIDRNLSALTAPTPTPRLGSEATRRDVNFDLIDDTE